MRNHMLTEARLENFSIWTMKKQHIKEIICWAKRGKKIMEKLNRTQKCSILGPQNLGSRGGPGPRAPLDARLGNWTQSLVYKSDAYPTVLRRHVLNRNRRSLNFVSCTTSLFGLGSFLDSIEHDFIRIWTSETVNL